MDGQLIYTLKYVIVDLKTYRIRTDKSWRSEIRMVRVQENPPRSEIGHVAMKIFERPRGFTRENITKSTVNEINHQ
jgi:hypothetical protein